MEFITSWVILTTITLLIAFMLIWASVSAPKLMEFMEVITAGLVAALVFTFITSL